VTLAENPVLEGAEADGGPLDGVIYWFMSFDQNTNQLIEIGIFGLAAFLTAYSAKATYDKWQNEKEQDDTELKDKLKRAMSSIEPERAQRQSASVPEASRDEEIARSVTKKKIVSFGDADEDLPRVASTATTGRVRGKMRKKSPLQEASELENEVPADLDL